MHRTSLTIRVPVEAPSPVTFAALTDWDSQSTWMFATEVKAVGPQQRTVGDRLEAFTGLQTPWGRIGFLDTMVVTEWIEERSVTVAHTGRVVRGSGTFGVTPNGPHASTVEWIEELDIPGGLLGRWLYAAVSPVSHAAVRFSLRRFADQLRRSAPRARSTLA